MSEVDKCTEINKRVIKLSYLEFYSGIGGWGFALEEACSKISSDKINNNLNLQVEAIRLAAFDHSDLANSVLTYNSKRSPEEKLTSLESPDKKRPKQEDVQNRKKKRKKAQVVPIEKLTPKQLNRYNAQVWIMSPPCQPYSRNNETSKRDDVDPRSKSFLHLCQLLKEMKKSNLPKIILMENVFGFESSNCCKKWRASLSDCGYAAGHFHISPVQVGIPNDRPRYYCLAVQLKMGREDTLSVIRKPFIEELSVHVCQEFSTNKPIEKDYKIDGLGSTHIQTHIPSLQVEKFVYDDPMQEPIPNLPPISNFLDENLSPQQFDLLRVPQKLLKTNASWCFDIVTPSDCRSSCFTHSYGRFVRGTGSVLYMINQDMKDNKEEKNSDLNDLNMHEVETQKKLKLVAPEERVFDSEWAKDLNLEERLRYFSGTEVARLMGFPVTTDDELQNNPFHFPPSLSLKQQWKLLGNSLNVKVASKIAELGLYLHLNQMEIEK